MKGSAFNDINNVYTPVIQMNVNTATIETATYISCSEFDY
jgi:hypothetical protein